MRRRGHPAGAGPACPGVGLLAVDSTSGAAETSCECLLAESELMNRIRTEAVSEISKKQRTALLKMCLALNPDSITVNHAIEQVRTNGHGRRHGVSDCLDELKDLRKGYIKEIQDSANELAQLEQDIAKIEIAMADKGITRCPHCADGKATAMLHERGIILNRGGSGNPIAGDWEECDCCGGEGVVQRGRGGS